MNYLIAEFHRILNKRKTVTHAFWQGANMKHAVQFVWATVLRFSRLFPRKELEWLRIKKKITCILQLHRARMFDFEHNVVPMPVDTLFSIRWSQVDDTNVNILAKLDTSFYRRKSFFVLFVDLPA